MENPFDQFDEPAGATAEANPFDQFDDAPAASPAVRTDKYANIGTGRTAPVGRMGTPQDFPVERPLPVYADDPYPITLDRSVTERTVQPATNDELAAELASGLVVDRAIETPKYPPLQPAPPIPGIEAGNDPRNWGEMGLMEQAGAAGENFVKGAAGVGTSAVRGTSSLHAQSAAGQVKFLDRIAASDPAISWNEVEISGGPGLQITVDNGPDMAPGFYYVQPGDPEYEFIKGSPNAQATARDTLVRESDPRNQAAFQGADTVDAKLRDKLYTNPQQDAAWLPGKLPNAMGSMAAFAGAGMALGPGGAAALGSASNAGSQLVDALASGADLETAFRASNRGAAIGSLEALPIEVLLSRLDKVSGGAIKQALLKALQTGTAEAAQEFTTQVLNNGWAAGEYDPNRDLFLGGRDAAEIGGASGAIMGFVTGLMGGRRGSSAQPSVQPAPGATAPAPGAQPPAPGAQLPPRTAITDGNPFDQFDDQPAPDNVPQGAVEAGTMLPQIQPEPAGAPAALDAGQNPQPTVQAPQATPAPPAPTVTRAEIQNLLDDPRTVEEIAAADRAAAQQPEMQQTVQPEPVAPIAAEQPVSTEALAPVNQIVPEAPPVDIDVNQPAPAAQPRNAAPKVTQEGGGFKVEMPDGFVYRGEAGAPFKSLKQAQAFADKEMAKGTKAAPIVVESGDQLRGQGAIVNGNASDPQKDDGNYQKLHARLKGEGLSFGIETPAGAPRIGPGGSWRLENSPADYGYIKGTKGADGDQIDAYFADGPLKGTVYVIDQIDAETGKFDEHKTILGAKSREEAIDIYNRGFSDGKGPQRMGAISEMGWPQFKNWIRKPGQRKRPVTWKAPAASPSAAGKGTADALQGSIAPSPAAAPAGPKRDVSIVVGYGSRRQQQNILQRARKRLGAKFQRSTIVPIDGTYRIIMKGATQEEADRIQAEVDRQTDIILKTTEAARKRGAPKSSRQESLAEWVARKGGIQDLGGDLKSQDLDRWHIGKPGMPKLIASADAAKQSGMFGGKSTGWSTQPDMVEKMARDEGFLRPGESIISALIEDAKTPRARLGEQVDTSEADAATDREQGIAEAQSVGSELMGRPIDAAKATEIFDRFMAGRSDSIQDAALDVLEDDMVRLVDETSKAAEEPFDDVADIPFDMPTKESSRGQEPGQVYPPSREAGKESEGASSQAPEAARGGEGAAADQGPKKLAAGEVVKTATGRNTTPFPKVDVTSSGKTANTLKRVDRWLMENALAEAEARGDEFNARQFRANLDKPQQADKDSAEFYLFDKESIQPNRPNILKPLVPPVGDQTQGLSRIDAADQRLKELFPAEQKARQDFRAGKITPAEFEEGIRPYKEAMAEYDAAFAEEQAKPEKKPAKAPRKQKGPSFIDRLRNYYQPGRIVRGYGGIYDKVISFSADDNQWAVTVQYSDKDGNPVADKRVRTHQTSPDEREMLAWEKNNPVPEKTDQGMQSVMPGMEQTADQKKAANRSKNRDVKDGLFAPRETPSEDGEQISLQEPKPGSLGAMGITRKAETATEATPAQANLAGEHAVYSVNEQITAGNLKSEKAWKRRGEAYETAIKLIEQMTGITDLRLVIADALSYEGRDIGGFFQALDKTLGVAITSTNYDPTWTLGHEVMHLMRQTGLIDNVTWDKLVEAAEKSDWLARYEIERRYPNLSDAKKMEEAIAEAYGEYVHGKLKGVPQDARSAFTKIKEFFRRLRQALRAKFGWETADDIFGQAFSGYFAQPTGIGEVSRQDLYTGTSLMALGATPPVPRTKPPFSVSQLVKDFKSRPVDEAFRLPFRMLGHLPGKAGKAFEIDQNRVWAPSKKVFALWKKVVEDSKFDDTGKFKWMNPILDGARIQLGIDLGLTEAYQQQRQKRKLDAHAIMFRGEKALERIQNAKLTPDQQKALYEAMTGEPVKDVSILGLAEDLATDIAAMGEEAVSLGLISQEALDRNKFAYMHRVYLQHETRDGVVAKFASSVLRRRRVRFLGDSFKGRGMYQKVTYAQIAKDAGNPNVLISEGSKISVFDILSPDGTRTIKRVYLPKSQASQASKEWQFMGDFEVRSKVKGEFVIWRDFTKNERESMGEIMDARYQLARTYQILANDLATGRFFADIAQNRDWATDVEPPREKWVEASDWNRFGFNSTSTEWVKVPTDKLPKSDTKRWGALAGKYVRAEIWRDLNETEIAQSPQLWRKLMNQWKLNKTARSLGVHVRNVMSNMMFMDLADVTFADLYDGIKSFINKDQYYQDAVEHGAFGADMISEEIRTKHLDPILKQLLREAKPDAGTAGAMNALTRMSAIIYTKAKAIDNKMIEAYRLEDEVFRLAMYHKMRTQGYTAVEAAEAARDQFINYDIQAPLINYLRQNYLPFLSYTYRAIPLIAKNITMRPWKIAKYVALYHMLDMLSYSLWDGDDEEDDALKPDYERQAATLGVIPIGDELMRLGTIDGDTYYLRVSDYMPGGNLLDQSANGLPRIFNPGFVLGVGMELYMNKSAFTGQEIYGKPGDSTLDSAGAISDHLWKWWMPSSPWIPGSHYWDKIGAGISGETDSVGEEVSPYLAAAQSVGIKITKVNKDNARKRIAKFANFDMSELQDEIYAVRRKVQRNKMSREDGLEKIKELTAQKKEIADEAKRRINAGRSK